MSRWYFKRTYKEGEFYYWSKDGSSEPWSEMEGLAHAVVGYFAKGRERRFGGYSAEVGLDFEGLQELGCAHGFSEAINAIGMGLGL
jgi:hypothetical protein